MTRQHAIAAAIGLATLATFAPVVFNGVNPLDDPRYVFHNPQVRAGLSVEGLRWALWNGGYAANWHPLTWLSHMLDAELFGADNAAAQHAVSAILHAAAAAVLFIALARATGALGASAFVALAFALHPLRVESVAWIAERKDVLAALFWVLTTWAYVRWSEARAVKWYAATVLLYAIGLCAKPLLVTLPCTLLLLDVWPLARLGRPGDGAREVGRRVVEKLPLFILAAIASVLTIHAQTAGGAIVQTAIVPARDRVAVALVGYATYLRQTVWPAGLAPYYPHPLTSGQVGLHPTEVAAAATLLAVLTALAVWAFVGGRRHALIGWLFYLGTLVPMVGLVQVGTQAHADRYTYIPSIGLYLALAWGVRDAALTGRLARRAAVAGAVSALAACALLTVVQVGRWRSDYTLYAHTVAVTEKNALAHTLLGVAMIDRGEVEAGAHHLTLAAAIDPNEADARIHLARLYLAEERPGEALRPLTELLTVMPGHAEGHLRMGLALTAVEREAEAVSHFSRAIDIPGAAPDVVLAAHLNLAEHFQARGALRRAVLHHEAVLQRSPDLAWSLNSLAWIYATDRTLLDPARALALAERACSASGGGDDPSRLDTLAAAYAANGDFARAATTAERALEQLPAETDGGGELRAAISARRDGYRQGIAFFEPGS